MFPGGDQIVTRALGGGGRQNGRGDLQEVVVHHGGADGGDHLAAQDDIFLDLRVAQVQIAVFQAQGLVSFAAVVDLEGQFVILTFAQDFNFLGDHLHVSSG